MAELIFLRRYGLQHKYASENGFLVATESGQQEENAESVARES
jgi:hypothetical protein